MAQSVLILGATGMLGHKLCQKLPQMGFQVFATYRALQDLELPRVQLIQLDDIQDTQRLDTIIKENKPDVVINCIGIVKQSTYAEDRYLSVAINALLPHQLQKICENHNARLVHISTDCVFNGAKGMYLESDPSDAYDVYGKSKYLGETTDEQSNAITLRTSIIGHEAKISTHGLLGWFFQQRNKTVNGYKEAFFSGFTTNELARIITLLITEHPKLCGTYHVASNRISKYDLLMLINDIYDLKVTINPESEFYCDRSLQMTSFSNITGYQAPTWSDMIQNMYTEETEEGSHDF